MPTEDAIRQRAYYLWENDGRPDGRSDHYWQLALEEATAAMDTAAQAKSAKLARASKPAKAEAPAKPKKAAARKVDDKPAKKATKPRVAVLPKSK